MIKIHNLTPNTFHHRYFLTQCESTTLSDYCWLLGIPFSFDEDSYLCEVELPKGYDNKLNFKDIDWSFLAKNKSKKLILTHRIIYSLSDYIDELNDIILKYDLKDQVFWLSMNPHDFKHKDNINFKLLFLDSLVHVIFEWSVYYFFYYFKYQDKINITSNYNIPISDSRFNLPYPINEIKRHKRLKFKKCNKYFFSASKMQKAHRLLATYLIHNNIRSSESIITQHGVEVLPQDVNSYLYDFADRLDHFNIDINELIKFKDFRGGSFGEESIPEENVATDIVSTTSQAFQEVFKSCLIQYVHESTSNEVEIYISEKTWANYLFGRPFIINGNKGSLHYLNKYYGFKSFGDIFDESYDLMDNYVDRVYYGVEQLQKFCSLDFDEAKRRVKSLEDVYDHNYKVLTSLDFRKIFMRTFDDV
tara:strand:+ start:5907 stop:7160 length:1254 start_codon:yes stop_codon:yes gene_type:complete